MVCQCAATACCAAAVILGVSLPLLSLRLMLLRILLKMGMLECLLCFPEESSLRGCPASPTSKQNQLVSDPHNMTSASPNDRQCICHSTGLGRGRSAGRVVCYMRKPCM